MANVYRTALNPPSKHYDFDTTNEARADWAERAIKNGCDAEADSLDLTEHPEVVYQDLKDLVSNLIHFCHRAGIEWDEVESAAVDAAIGDLEDGPEAKRDAERFPEVST